MDVFMNIVGRKQIFKDSGQRQVSVMQRWGGRGPGQEGRQKFTENGQGWLACPQTVPQGCTDVPWG